MSLMPRKENYELSLVEGDIGFDAHKLSGIFEHILYILHDSHVNCLRLTNPGETIGTIVW